jgi:hypothetical protein
MIRFEVRQCGLQGAVQEAVKCGTRGKEGWKLTFVGHSVGGAEAAVAAASFAASGYATLSTSSSPPIS